MESTNWYKQVLGSPLFPDLQWSRPENRQHAGKLLIIGGNLHGFSAAASAYSEAVNAGIGTAKVLLPDALRKTIGSIMENGEYAPSTPSGSFSQKAIAEWLDWAVWSDGVLLAGDLGKNSETAIAIEQFIQKYTGQLTVTKDAVDYFYSSSELLLTRKDTTIVLSLPQLQKLAVALHWPEPVTFQMGIVQLVEFLHKFSNKYPTQIMVYHNETILVAVAGKVSTTKTGQQKTWRVSTATHAAVWWLQNPSKPFEALTTAILDSLEDQKTK
jgi:hypothetical protein